MPASYAYFEHGADIGVSGRGASVEEAFAQAAAATFAIMAEPASVRPEVEIEVDFEESDIDFALVRWLNALLAQAREQGLVLGRFEVKRSGEGWHGLARGEPWRDSHERGTEVKGATLTALSVRQDDDGWVARCVVDV